MELADSTRSLRASDVVPREARSLHRSYWVLVYLGVGLTSLATLLFELSITRLFSVILYYHFAFLAISIALFGLGVGGVLSYPVAAWKGGTFAKIAYIALLTGVLVVCALLFIVTRGGRLGFSTLLEFYFASAIPFLGSGIILSLAISETVQRVDRVYFADLSGAGASCLLLVPLLNYIGAPSTIIASGFLFATAGAIWFILAHRRTLAAAGILLAGGLLGLAIYNAHVPLIDVQYAKGARISDEIFVRWNSFSRIALRSHGSGLYSIDIDADANTYVANYNFDTLPEAIRSALLRCGRGAPYLLRPGRKVLIIGPGGGVDIGRALASQSRDVTGVEINPIIAKTIMEDRFPQLSNYLYRRPEVHIAVEDGRSYIRRSPDRYAVIQATLVDTWASTAAGAFALSENSLYTTDAFYDYLSHLTDDGIVSFTRWGVEPPRESLRLVALGQAALERIGEHEYWRHFILLREDSGLGPNWGSLDTVLISRKPFSDRDIRLIKGLAAQTGSELLYLPGENISGAFTDRLQSSDVRKFEREYPYDVSAIGDDRPFFFYTVRFGGMWKFITQYLHARINKSGAADYKLNVALPVLFGSLAVSIVATGLILIMPPLLARAKLPQDGMLRLFLWYFVAIGAGYILIEVALIQKFVLFLGHPTYSLTVIIFSLLASSGVGSFLSRRIIVGSDSRLEIGLVTIALLTTLLAITLTPILGRGVGWPLPFKIAVAVTLVAPLGFAMGMPFPTGLSKLEARFPPAVRWAWSVNAAASVLGSVSAIFLAIHLGLRLTLLFGGVMYLVALAIVRIAGRSPTRDLKQIPTVMAAAEPRGSAASA